MAHWWIKRLTKKAKRTTLLEGTLFSHNQRGCVLPTNIKSDAEVNLKAYWKAITLRSGKKLEAKKWKEIEDKVKEAIIESTKEALKPNGI